MKKENEKNEKKEITIVEKDNSDNFILAKASGEEMLKVASSIATPLAKLIEDKKLYTLIPAGKTQKKYVNCEGWTTLGAMVGLFPRIVKVEEKSTPNGVEFIAEAEAVTASGKVISRAVSGCSSEEYNWQKASKYAIRSMAETRAVSKVMRLVLSWIMTLAGYEPTPAEEVDFMQHQQSTQKPTQKLTQKLTQNHKIKSKPKNTKTQTNEKKRMKLIKEISNLVAGLQDISLDEIKNKTKEWIGKDTLKKATLQELEIVKEKMMELYNKEQGFDNVIPDDDIPFEDTPDSEEEVK